MPHDTDPIYAVHCLCGCGGTVEITSNRAVISDLILRGYVIERIDREEATTRRLGCLDAPEAARPPGCSRRRTARGVGNCGGDVTAAPWPKCSRSARRSGTTA